jgi:ATP-dependent Clp protease ATP-binding subunit ClpA
MVAELSQRVIGQQEGLLQIVPFINMFESGLAAEGRPVGVFLLLGPTGTGKTRTVEALAEVLHGSAKNVLKVDCGEFQMEHEVAKLVGAPPGYLGHRETQPMLTQARLASVASDRSALSIVLFDEIEKAAPSLTRLLLGVLDKATLRLGDNNTVNFERSIVFLTSNLGASGMMKAINPDFGFAASVGAPGNGDTARSIESIAMHAAKVQFSPEFLNRVDAVITYQPLGEETLRQILDLQISEMQMHIRRRLGERAFYLEVPTRSKLFLLKKGTSREYGAREIRRTLQRHVMHPLAEMVAAGEIRPGALVIADLNSTRDKVKLKVAA